MNIMTKRNQDNNIITYEHICDTREDMANINNNYITLGSICIVLSGEDNNLEIYMADNNNQWKNILSGDWISNSSAFLASLAGEYDPEHNTYNPGDLCIHNKKLYINKFGMTLDGEWDDSYWQETTIAELITSTSEDSAVDILPLIAEPYDETKYYQEGNLCSYNEKLYICIVGTEGGAWDDTYWEETTLSNILKKCVGITTEDITNEEQTFFRNIISAAEKNDFQCLKNQIYTINGIVQWWGADDISVFGNIQVNRNFDTITVSTPNTLNSDLYVLLNNKNEIQIAPEILDSWYGANTANQRTGVTNDSTEYNMTVRLSNSLNILPNTVNLCTVDAFGSQSSLVSINSPTVIKTNYTNTHGLILYIPRNIGRNHFSFNIAIYK